ncbi:rab GTPase-activating protein 22 isoform X3 [Gossypium hirsutum]|uniref:Rab GTPase-activating protein 22 isoform X3 n=1 Tax=Gossypium hirsutum TaxID=3635 RepID=A0ABM3B2V2_GOSHI|nr:rab GTPase-activating protein 22 isoform X3 [Gossypium hirsutum]
MVNAFIRVTDREKKKQKGRQNSNRDFSFDLTAVFPYIAIFMLFFSTGDGIEGLRKWILFAEASTAGGGGGGGFWSYYSVVSPSGIAIAVTAMAGIALAATIVYSRSTFVSFCRGSLKSPWALRKRKYALQPKQWKSLFTPDGKLGDGGVKFLKKVRSGGVDPSIRAEVWPYLLGVYDLNSSKEERDSIRRQKRKEFERLRKRCRQILKRIENSSTVKETAGNNCNEDSEDLSQVVDSSGLEDVVSGGRSTEGESPMVDDSENSSKVKETAGNNCNEDSEDLSQVVDSLGLEDVVSDRRSTKGENPMVDDSDRPPRDQSHQTLVSSDSDSEGGIDKSEITCEDDSPGETESSGSNTSDEDENIPLFASEITEENNIDKDDNSSASRIKSRSKSHADEDFATWQRIIRVDAVRANDEWIAYSSTQALVSEMKAYQLAESVGLKEYDHLEPCRIYHAARLVAILEAYTLYDPEIGYCQGMSDLLSPIISVVEDDSEAFWCFSGFMKKARHNFRLDEVGIRRQLNIVSKIIKCKDSHLYRHLEELQAEDCFFVYRMVVVLFRRELSFEQTLCLWEVVWADQAAIRAGITKTSWGRMRLRAPPTDDLLLYAIAACVLQRRKLIIEMYSSMDEIMRECHSMAGRLDVWKLLDDAHGLVVNLHDKI